MTDSQMFEAQVEWQIFGHVDAHEYVTTLLSNWDGSGSADADDPDFFLRDYGINVVKKGGPFGLQYVSFWVVTPLSPKDGQRATEVIKARLDRMVGDTDTDVRWVELFTG